MTGWGRGFCAGYGGRGGRRAFGAGFGWGGFGRGSRHRFWGAGLPGWGRGWFGEPYFAPSYSREDEIAALREEAAWLKEELKAVERRLSELASRQAEER